MVSLTVHLDDHVAEAIRQLAAAQNCSETEIIRNVLTVYAQNQRPLPTGLGEYHSGQRDTAARARNILRSAVRENESP